MYVHLLTIKKEMKFPEKDSEMIEILDSENKRIATGIYCKDSDFLSFFPEKGIQTSFHIFEDYYSVTIEYGDVDIKFIMPGILGNRKRQSSCGYDEKGVLIIRV